VAWSFSWSFGVRRLGQDNPLEPCRTCEVRGKGQHYPVPTDLRLGHQQLKCPECNLVGTNDYNLASAIRGWNGMQNNLRNGHRVI
jgi:hypothetical protein